MVRRGAREGQAERHIHRAAETRDLDCCHPHVVIRRDHRVKLTPHGAHEHRVGRERSCHSHLAGHRSEQEVVFGAKAPAVARVRVERAESQARLGNAELVAQPRTGHTRRAPERISCDRAWHIAERNVRGREHHAECVGGEHHRDRAPGERGKHLRVPGKVVAAGE